MFRPRKAGRFSPTRTRDSDSRIASFERRVKFVMALLAGGIVIALALLRGADLLWRRDQIRQAAERRASNLVLILAEYLREAFRSTDACLGQLAVHARQVGGPSAPPREWTEFLAAAKVSLNGVGSLSVVDAEGVIRHSTLPEIVGQSRKDQYVFSRLAEDPTDVLVADKPFRTLTGSNRIILPVGRRLTREDGVFDGIVVATFGPDDLRTFLRTVDVGQSGALWVFHPEGVVLFHEPSSEDPIGEPAAQNPIFAAARSEASPTLLQAPLAPGGPRLLSALRLVEAPPLLAAISLGEDEVLADWRREVTVSATVLAGFAIGLAGVLLLLFRQFDARVVAEQAMTRSRRLEAIGHLTGGVAHDFNNLLTVILGNAQRLKGLDLPPRALSGASQIERAAQRAAELTRRMLAFARRQPLQPRVVDLREVVRGLAPMLERLLGEDVSLRVKQSPSVCLADVDPVQVETAIMNLCVNARDAMPQGGVLVLETAPASIDEDYARLNIDAAPGPHVMVAVSDTGVGIPPENLPRLFEPFFTTKDVGKGTGLGLSTVYGFVRQSGGHVKIYSELGHGTAVKLYFPAAQGVEATVGKRPVEAEPAQGGETILLVEDESDVRELCAEILADLGYRVIAAPDGPAALVLAERAPRIDLLFTDVVLPRAMSGRQLAEELGRRRPGLPVLFASGYSQEIVEERGHLTPGLRLVSKPYTREQVALAVRAALRGETISPSR